ncbi:hypothetical protein EYF80_023910 [Liparis tanakae]|uniref:Uncharacterized protein n=1 Tax=Liparis tanakae TaxID=230148 RepID=A0A4Z2HJY8_9TELE|nr:hypothetical protein EYF80_023910 [Liparis tanakae]
MCGSALKTESAPGFPQDTGPMAALLFRLLPPGAATWYYTSRRPIHTGSRGAKGNHKTVNNKCFITGCVDILEQIARLYLLLPASRITSDSLFHPPHSAIAGPRQVLQGPEWCTWSYLWAPIKDGVQRAPPVRILSWRADEELQGGCDTSMSTDGAIAASTLISRKVLAMRTDRRRLGSGSTWPH